MMLTRRRVLLPSLLLGLPSRARPAAAEEPLGLDALLSRIAAGGERRATFREQRRFAAIEGTLESAGTLLFRPGRLEKVTTWPQPERLEVEGDRLVLTTGNDPPRVIDMASAPGMRVLIDAVRGPLLGDATALRRAFITEVSGTWAGWTLDMRPRDPDAAKFLRAARLAGHDGQPTRLTLIQANGDTQVTTISPSPPGAGG